MTVAHGVVSTDGSLEKGVFEDWLPGTQSLQYATDDIAVATSQRSSNQSATAETDSVRCWLIGQVYGHSITGRDGSETYRSKPDQFTSAEFCLSLYERTGFEFLEELNGNYTLLLYDETRRRFAICTDRFGTVPIYWTQTDDTVVFSTNIQYLPFHPAVDTAYYPAYLHEYLAFRCTFGVRTPLEGIEKLEPGTITSIMLEERSIRTEQYWRPHYEPRAESFEWFVEEFAARFQKSTSPTTYE
jgi:asparagine synthase (glutamine-hydrolysing)